MQETLKTVNRILARALRELGNLGEAEKACDLAAQAWSALREGDAKEAERMNGVLHQLTSTRCGAAAAIDHSKGHFNAQLDQQSGLDQDAGQAQGGEGSGGSGNSADSSISDFELEVRPLPPAQRHELIFETYHKLQPGQGFILINDHDPIPLYYQFAFEHPDQFTWAAIESGPKVWRVRIGKP